MDLKPLGSWTTLPQGWSRFIYKGEPYRVFRAKYGVWRVYRLVADDLFVTVWASWPMTAALPHEVPQQWETPDSISATMLAALQREGASE